MPRRVASTMRARNIYISFTKCAEEADVPVVPWDALSEGLEDRATVASYQLAG